ncbi:MAG: ABC transporter ATP-binding protein [Oscillospiraceae bacterium]|jgi:branched-chain amino acid transport system ATP-binding protein|nr:ABC transporter ATP-binding protein [Oscillospiraceae bacterium]
MNRQAVPDSEVALKLSNLSVSYGRIEALKQVDLRVNKGEIVALLGANGAGKSSTLKAISGLVEPSGGSISAYGTRISGMAAEKIVRKGIIQAPEGRQIFFELTVEENLLVGGFTAPSRVEQRERLEGAYEYFPRLKERRGQVAGTLSGGEQQMLAIGRALMANPQVLLLDEPSLGLAPLIVQTIFEIIRTLNEKGTTILLVEQNAKQSLKIAHYAYVMEVGIISLEGRGQDLLADPRVIEAYLGKQ